MNVTTIALVDSNADPTVIDYPIPGNDDAIRSISIIVKTIADAYLEGKEMHDKKQAKEEKSDDKVEDKKSEVKKEVEVEPKKEDKKVVKKSEVKKPAAKKTVKKTKNPPHQLAGGGKKEK
jgi:small subunit ribosomal protein S2